MSTSLTPTQAGCNPPLSETNWEDRALEFLERGKSRFLLNATLQTRQLPGKPRELIKRVLQSLQIPARHKGTVWPSVSLVPPEPQTGKEETKKDSRIKARKHWQKAIDTVRASRWPQLKKYPVINSALPNRSESMGDMRAKIPRDTVAVTLSQASKSPQNFIAIVMTSQKVKKST
jgi:hypothetical protein